MRNNSLPGGHEHTWGEWLDALDFYTLVSPADVSVTARMCSRPTCGVQQLRVNGVIVEWDVGRLAQPARNGVCVACREPSETSPCQQCLEATYRLLGKLQKRCR